MANAPKAIEFMLHQEDAKLSGVITNAASDNGGQTRFGLCAKWHPALVKAGFFSASMPQPQALSLAEETYQKEYAVPLRLAQLSSDAVACALISFAVLDGIGSAIKLLRSALDVCGLKFPETSAPINDATFNAEQEVPESKLVPALVRQQRNRCEQIAAEEPSQRKWIAGWENRADQVLALVTS